MDERLSKRINIESENITEIFNKIPSHVRLPYLSTVELAGTAALLHSFYNGIENILKQIFIANNLEIPEGKSSHKELLETAVNKKIIFEKCKNSFGEYLAFRHFFNHAYAFDLYPNKMEPLVEDAQEVYSNFREEIAKYL